MTKLQNIDRRAFFKGTATAVPVALATSAPAIAEARSQIALLWERHERIAEAKERLFVELQAAEKREAMQHEQPKQEALMGSGAAAAEERYVNAFNELWDIDDAIVAARVTSLEDLQIKARVVEFRSVDDAAPDDYISKLLADVQTFSVRSV